MTFRCSVVVIPCGSGRVIHYKQQEKTDPLVRSRDLQYIQ